MLSRKIVTCQWKASAFEWLPSSLNWTSIRNIEHGGQMIERDMDRMERDPKFQDELGMRKEAIGLYGTFVG